MCNTKHAAARSGSSVVAGAVDDGFNLAEQLLVNHDVHHHEHHNHAHAHHEVEQHVQGGIKAVDKTSSSYFSPQIQFESVTRPQFKHSESMPHPNGGNATTMIGGCTISASNTANIRKIQSSVLGVVINEGEYTKNGPIYMID